MRQANKIHFVYSIYTTRLILNKNVYISISLSTLFFHLDTSIFKKINVTAFLIHNNTSVNLDFQCKTYET